MNILQIPKVMIWINPYFQSGNENGLATKNCIMIKMQENKNGRIGRGDFYFWG